MLNDKSFLLNNPLKLIYFRPSIGQKIAHAVIADRFQFGGQQIDDQDVFGGAGVFVSGDQRDALEWFERTEETLFAEVGAFGVEVVAHQHDVAAAAE